MQMPQQLPGAVAFIIICLFLFCCYYFLLPSTGCANDKRLELASGGRKGTES